MGSGLTEIGIKENNQGDCVENSSDEYPLLTKEDLLRIDHEQPRWRWVRIAIVVLFWVLWTGLIVASALLIHFNPRCPVRPSQEFWQSEVGYWINPFTFKDSNSDSIGDLKGIISETSYIRHSIGAGYVVLTSMVPIYPLNIENDNNLTFTEIHSKLGNLDDFKSLLRIFKKDGLKVVVSLNLNSIPVDHVLAKSQYLLNAQNSTFCRVSGNCSVSVDNGMFYSTYGSNSRLVDLNLLSSDVLTEIKAAVKFWLDQGADGILLEDAAFYVENSDCTTDTWKAGFPKCKLYTSGTLTVINELRKVVDKVSSDTSRHRVLMADPGNTGYGSEKADSLLGSEDLPGAHLVICREFTYSRGFPSQNEPSLAKYTQSINSSIADKFALTIATPSDQWYASAFSTAAVFMLPGPSLIYAGSELGVSPKNQLPRSEIFPFGEENPLNSYAGFLPMPWDTRGAGFSESDAVKEHFATYLSDLNIAETVETSLAAGRGSSIFNLTTTLVQLRKGTPALQWGKLDTNLSLTLSNTVDVFKRSAEGFEDVYVVLARSSSLSSVIDFSSECSTLVFLLAYPPHDQFVPNTEVPKKQVFLQPKNEDSLYVFKCSA